jgi:hypothetical protein
MAAHEQDQAVIAIMEIAVCIAQAMHEVDPGAAARMNFAAGKAYNRLKEEGNDTAAEIVYRFGRLLLDHDIFPVPDEPAAETT